jgi:hypothetical protein
MATDNKMWLKEIANSFGLTISQFADAIGYSRQTLYRASCGYGKLSKTRIGLTAYKLIEFSDKMLEIDIQLANERHAARRKLIDDFKKRFTVEDE